MIPISPHKKPLLAQVQTKQLIDSVNLIHVFWAGVSLMQNSLDAGSDLLGYQKRLRYLANEFGKELETQIRAMQNIADDDQLETLRNNETLEKAIKILVKSAKNGTINDVLGILENHENKQNATK